MDRSERRRRTQNIIAQRKRVMRWNHMDEWATARTIGRCKKLHPLDCGRARCGICRIKRRWLGKTRQEKIADLDYDDERDIN